MRISRRSLLGAGAAGVAGAILPSAWQANIWKELDRTGRAKNVVFCVVDGMAVSVMSMVDHLSRLSGKGPSYWAWLMDQDFVTNGLQETRSLNSVVTDSSAASSAWGSGRRIWNGQVNQFPDGTKLITLYDLAKAAGVRTGLVTTATVTHATPAGFSVSTPDRDDEAKIAELYLDSGVDVLCGGGDKFFSAKSRKDKRDLYADFVGKGYAVVKSRDELLASASRKVLGVFNGSHLPYSVDRNNSPELQAKIPTLAEMTNSALENLKDSAKGFLLQVEGARVDHGGHSVDLAAAVFDQMAFEDALRVVVDFALKDGETLVVITADHATGGPALNGAGAEYIDSTAGLERLLKMKSSYSPMLGLMAPHPKPEKIREVLEAKLAIQVKPAEARTIADALEGKFEFGTSEFHRTVNTSLAMVIGNYSKVTWTSGNHTSDHVIVSALGPGRELVHGMTANTSFFDVMSAQFDLKCSNPTMTFEEAKPHYEKLKKGGGEFAEHWM